MKILVPGGNGQVGWELAKRNGQDDFEILALSHTQLDIHHVPSVKVIMSTFKPDFVVNAAAFTAVDHAEDHPESAYVTNRDGPAVLAEICAANEVPILHLSTDYVFNGLQRAGYKETDKPAPLNVYGQSKLDGELAVSSRCKQHLILRVNGVYGCYGVNFVKKVLHLAGEHDVLRMVKDQKCNPTSAIEIADVILEMVRQMHESPVKSKWGKYHYCSAKGISWCGFARAIIKLAKKHQEFKVQRVLGISSDELDRKAARPKNVTLNCHKIKKNFGIKQASRDKYLKLVIDELLG